MPKITLSPAELELASDAGIILTKNRVIEKVYALFGEVSEAYTAASGAAAAFYPEVFAAGPKISRGENYGGLPWVMLDQPRYFTSVNVFAVRSFFWWGNFFSITIQLKGIYAEKLQAKLLQFAHSGSDVFIGVNAVSDWEHHFDDNNYLPARQVDITAVMRNGQAFKMAKKIPIGKWEDVPAIMLEFYMALMQVVCS